jgi:hypothetical protein
MAGIRSTLTLSGFLALHGASGDAPAGGRQSGRAPVTARPGVRRRRLGSVLPGRRSVSRARAVGTALGRRAACRGDCDGDGSVTIDELIAAVGIALGESGVEQCPSLDGDGDGASP